MALVHSLRDHSVTHSPNAIDIDVGCGRQAREAFEFVIASRTGELKGHRFSVRGETVV